MILSSQENFVLFASLSVENKYNTFDAVRNNLNPLASMTNSESVHFYGSCVL